MPLFLLAFCFSSSFQLFCATEYVLWRGWMDGRIAAGIALQLQRGQRGAHSRRLRPVPFLARRVCFDGCACMTGIYLQFECAHYGLYSNSPAGAGGVPSWARIHPKWGNVEVCLAYLPLTTRHTLTTAAFA